MATSCLSCSVRRSCFAGEFDKKGLTIFSAALHRFSVRGKGRAIFNQGEPADRCYFLCNGVVKLTRLLMTGDEIILDVLAAPCGLGKCDELQRSVHFPSVVALTESVELAYIETDILLDLLKDYPSAMQRLLIHFREQTEKVYKLLASMKLKVRERLLSVIALNFFLAIKGDAPATVPLSNVEIAQLIQTTPETVSRILRQLQAEGLVGWDAKGILTIKPRILRECLDQFD